MREWGFESLPGHLLLDTKGTELTIARRNIRLLPGESIILEVDQAVLTNQRVLADWKGREGGSPSIEKPLDDILEYDKFNGGRESRVQLGLQLMAAGLGLLIVNLLLHRATGGLPELVDSVLFIVLSAALIYGTYVLALSYVNPRPRTTILFTDVDAKTFALTFPGWDNPQAQEFAVRFDRAKQEL